jgi:uncharacterized membrane protein HdeD (DUF308 family)
MSKGFRNTLLAISLVYILLGLIQIIWPVGSRLVICYILGAALIIYGIYHIIRYFNAAPGYSFPGMGLALGTSCGVIGLLMIICAKGIVAVFGVAMGVAVITDSILRLQLSFNMMRYKLGKYIAVMIFSLLMLIAGIIMVFNPIESAATATVVMGCCMLVDGIMNLISIIFAKKMLTEV